MAIKKVVKVENVGRLERLAAQGDVSFRRLTLIYGANGNGKTTLASVFRSFQTGDATYIQERKTLGSDATCAVQLLMSDGPATFSNQSWDRIGQALEVFDTTFVNDNVYTGDTIDQEHRKNLYQVVVGASAVRLAKTVDELDTQGRALARSITDLEGQLRQHIQAPFDLDAFLALERQRDVEANISDATSRLNAVRKNSELVARPQLEALAVPKAPENIVEVLKKTVERMAADGLRKVESHLHERLGPDGEQWVRQGIQFRREDNCPFCGQSTSGVELVGLFGRYFSTAYNDHVVELQRCANELRQTFSDEAFSRVEKRIVENDSRIASWADLADLSAAKLSVERLAATWRHLVATLDERLRRKLAQPGFALGNDEEVQAALQDYTTAASGVLAHNAAIREANDRISELKKQAASTEATSLEAELRQLRNTQIRHQPEVNALCDKLANARHSKTALDNEKVATREELKKQAGDVLATFEAAINRLLTNFGATFRITGTKPSFAGGPASSTYQIAINNLPIELGDSRAPRGKPCFRSALSAGDKSTLALAFFMARLQQDGDNLGSKIVIFDDPLSSLDCFRISCTQQEICSLAQRAEQVVVLSHDAAFLKRIFDASTKAEAKALHFVRDGGAYTLKEWEIQSYFLKEAHQDYFILRQFVADGLPAGGDLRTVARSIRPYLEGHLRHRFPDAFAENEWLGDFIKKIREAGAGTPLSAARPSLDELSALNDFASPFHHTERNAAVPPTSDSELRTYAERTIRLVQGAT